MSRSWRFKHIIGVALGLALAVLLTVASTGCGGSDDDAAPSGGASATGTGGEVATSTPEVASLEIAVAPFLDTQPLRLAKDLGLDKEMQLDFSRVFVVEGDQQVARAVLRGDADVGTICHACILPMIENAPELKNWAIKDRFAGFQIIGRVGELPTYEERIEAGSDPNVAAKEVLTAWDGKSFCMVAASNDPLIKGALRAQGLSADHVNFTFFADDAKAALAFLGGNCDLYTGSLPTTTEILREQGGKYVRIGGTEILGPGGLWFDTYVSTESWLNDNEDAALRLLAVHYRTMRYIREEWDQVGKRFTALVNDAAATNLPVDEVYERATEYTRLYTFDEAREEVFNPDHEFYWRNGAEFVFANADEKPADANIDDYEIEEVWWNKLLERDDLIEWIESPLPPAKLDE